MKRRPRRTVPATLVALVVLAAAVLVAVSCIQLLAGQTPWLPFTAMAEFGAGLAWNQPVMLAIAAAVALLGLVLLLAALKPGTPTVLPLASAENQPDTGATRSSLTNVLTTTAAGVDGVDKAKVRLGGRTVIARVHTPLRDPGELADHVRAAITDRLDDIGLARRPRIRVRVASTRDN
jgi:hypothetical protein